MAKTIISFLLMTTLYINLALGVPQAECQTDHPSIHPQYILNDISILSSPKFQGRQAGTKGGHESALFIARRFKSLGLKPSFPTSQEQPLDQWFQRLPITATQILSPVKVELFLPAGANTTTQEPFEVGQDFVPILDSPAVNVTAPVNFVGYGIVDPARRRNDYEGKDVRNRIVLFLRGKPTSYPRWITYEEKAQIAKEQGAAGILTVTGPILGQYEARRGLGQTPLAIYSTTPEHRPIPGAWINGGTLNEFLSPIDLSLETLQKIANETRPSHYRSLPLVAHLQWSSQRTTGFLTNVIGVLPGQNSRLRHEIIILGAHRDHFGEQAGLSFYGADDNASGTAVMLEIIRVLTMANYNPKRTILFVSFDGEERGLLGSRLYVNTPSHRLGKIIAMINLDHVGVGNGKLTVGITRLHKSLAQQAAKEAGLTDHIRFYGYFPGGDHVPFFENGLPTITVVSSGVHPHFHQPSDTAETIQSTILEKTAHFTLELIRTLDN